MTPILQTAVGLAIPFVGTALGAAFYESKFTLKSEAKRS